jgi:hypothetical protein
VLSAEIERKFPDMGVLWRIWRDVVAFGFDTPHPPFTMPVRGKNREKWTFVATYGKNKSPKSAFCLIKSQKNKSISPHRSQSTQRRNKVKSEKG